MSHCHKTPPMQISVKIEKGAELKAQEGKPTRAAWAHHPGGDSHCFFTGVFYRVVLPLRTSTQSNLSIAAAEECTPLSAA